MAVLGVAMATTVAAQAEPDPPSRTPVVTRVGVDYTYAWFAGTIAAWRLAAVSVETRRQAGTFIGRVNLARRFETNGVQVEADAYPRFGRNTHAYFNAGHSGSPVFPEWRYGAEVFQILPRAIEVSAGIRHLAFAGSPVTLFTGSVGQYAGNYWFSLRPFFRDTDEGLKASAGLTARKYYENTDSYLGARLGYGRMPSEFVDPSQLLLATSASAGFHGSRPVSPRTIVTWLLSYEREDPVSGATRNRWDIGTGVKLRF